MLIDRTHTRWIVASALMLLVATGFYVWYATQALNGPRGGSWEGLTYGIIGSFFILIAGGIGLRRKVRTWRIGKAQTWLRAHIWLGLLSFPMILFHAGFDFGPRWGLTWIMMWMFVVIIVSGVVGLTLQHTLPKLLTNRVPRETVYEEIDHIVTELGWEADALVSDTCGLLPDEAYDQAELARLRREAEEDLEHEKLAAEAKKNKQKPPPPPDRPVKNPAQMPDWMANKGIPADVWLKSKDLLPAKKAKRVKDSVPTEGSGPLRDFYLNEVVGFLKGPAEGSLASEMKSTALFNRIRTLIPPALHERLWDLESIVRERRQLAFQKRVHKWLHGWLLIHGPVSWAMILLSVIHAVFALYY